MLRVFCSLLISIAFASVSAEAAERSLPEEVRALAAICSSGANVELRGAIEGRLNILLGKMVVADGELKISEGREDFLQSFESEPMRVEALKVFNQCVIDAMKIIYNIRPGSNVGVKSTSILVPDPLESVLPGQRFSLRRGDSVLLDTGGVMTFQTSSRGGLAAYISNKGRRYSQNNGIKVGSSFKVPNSNCEIIYYSKRGKNKENDVHSFIYQCY